VSGPLDGFLILDLTRLLPGAYCTLLLADLGAEVVKVEEPNRGDPLRDAPPLVDGAGAAHLALDRGKRSITLDLKSPGGPEVLRRLAERAHAAVESFRPGVADRLGVGYEALSERNPRLVYCSLTGYGQDGPYRARPGHDVDYVALAGLLDPTGTPDGPPVIPAVQMADLAGGMGAAVGILACLLEAERGGRGRFVDVAMLDAAASWGALLWSTYLATGTPPARGRWFLTGALACYRVYATGDGKYLAVGALEPKFWRALCEALGVPELVQSQLDPERQDEFAERLEEIFLSRSRDEWVEALSGLEACVAAVNDVGEALADAQLVHRGMVGEAGGRVAGPGPLVKVSGHARGPVGPAPALGEHTEEVLTQAGFTPAQVAGLRQRHIV
jgi:crotonobetainyl-CoA:carnitine CoA-transferase CaiB-like acyl-CoA transferase